ncbi:trypsin-like peptidase domain-containing protein [Plantactinospora sp. CA-290183]|uniref:S1C family serine protease n=1 Tax=Plantactinospora sp. CA-290183 TaxID=3240006 RepID=UPI003D9374EA
MSEFETDPPRPPANPDREPSHPTAELPRVDRGQGGSGASGSTPTDATATPHTAPGDSTSDDTARIDAARFDSAPDDAGPSTPSQPYSAPPAPGQPYAAPAAAPASGPAGANPWQAPHAGQQYPQAGPQPGWAGHHHPGQQQGWAGAQPGHHPGWTGQQTHQPGWPGNPTHHPAAHAPGAGMSHQPHLGGPVPPWATGPGTGAPSGGPGRLGRIAAIGAAALVLMVGSGLAGGAIAVAVGDSGPSITRSYSSAPVINPADLPKIAAQVQDSVVSISTGSGEGSGVVMTADGFVLTNNHVVASANGGEVQVTFADGKRAAANIIGTDPKTDLAVVKAEGVSGLSAATFGDSDAMQVGDTVLALGSPLGLQGSVTAGIISARDRTIQAGGGQEEPQNPFQPRQQQGAVSSISGLLQTDAPINPGNSGGALVSTRGEVIGINTAIATAGQGTGNIGVGFAIPSNKARTVAEALQRGEKVSHPSLGVSLGDTENGGALVREVVANSPAAKAGLQQGDVVTQFGDKRINDSQDLVGAVQAGKVGDQVRVTYTRNGVEKTATVTLAEAS